MAGFNFSSLLNLSPTKTGKNPQPVFDQPSPFRKRRQGVANSLFASGNKPRLFPETPTLDSVGGRQAAGQQAASPVTMNLNLGQQPTNSSYGGPLPFYSGQGVNPYLNLLQPGGSSGLDISRAHQAGQFEAPETGIFADAQVDLGRTAQGSSTLANPDFLNYMLSGRLAPLSTLNPQMLRSLSNTNLSGLMGQYITEDTSLADITGALQRFTPRGL